MSQSAIIDTSQSESELISLFAAMAQNLEEKGYSIHSNALPLGLADKLWSHLQAMSPETFNQAGIGRDVNHIVNASIRRDEICWINGESKAGKEWLMWAKSLQDYLNQRLFLGLFSFESHFAHYAPGAFYKKHLDAFRGESNRILSIVVYLNSAWQSGDGGELILYAGVEGVDAIKVDPLWGTVVLFLSEEFPHEVLLTYRDRYSIAGWFRVNTTTADRVDPPR